MASLSKIMTSGFDVSLYDTGSLGIAPASNPTQSQRDLFKVHKVEQANG
jgi:hypothetical protein